VHVYKKEFYFIEVIAMPLQHRNNGKLHLNHRMIQLLAITNIYLIIVPLELFLKIINHISVQLEGLGENISIDGRIRSKDCICYGDDPRILAAETGKGYGIGMPRIKLEVNETNWKDKDVSSIKNFGEETVICVGCDKTN